jgi:predicted ATPase
MIGRDDAVADLCTQLLRQRFVTIVGPGGMGKTTVAVSVAHALVSEFSGAIAFVDLVAIEDSRLVAGTVASTLGLVVRTSDPISSLIGFLEQKRILLVLDNCEHVIESVAVLAERIYGAASQAYILATSRESLRVEGEHVHKLSPLGAPDAHCVRTAAETLTFPAVQLFMERAAAGGNPIDLSDADAHLVAGICRRLDGIALALELAAGRVGTYGIRGTAELLELRFKLVWQGRRTALPRHQTLNAMLDWSYNLLPEEEQRVILRLSVFVGAFTLEAAQAVAAEADTNAERTVEMVANLVAKSLIFAREGEASIRYRLLETTRAYALVKLAESGEADVIARRHAAYFVRLCGGDNSAVLPTDGSASPANAEHLGNVRAALEWCFSQRGDRQIGRDLVMAVVPWFLRLSLFAEVAECHSLSERTLALLSDADKGTERELALLESQALSALFTLGNHASVRAALQRGLDLASALRAGPQQLQLLAGLNLFLTRIGDFHGALRVAEESAAVALRMGDPAAAVMAEWMRGAAHHLTGDQRAAQLHCERGFAHEAALHRVNKQLFGYAHRIRALASFAGILWLRGFADRAVSVARQAVDEATQLAHPANECVSHICTATVLLWRGDWQAAEEAITTLIAEAKKYAFRPYYALGLGMQGELMVNQGYVSGGIAPLRQSLDILETEQHHIIFAPRISTALAQGFAASGDFALALATIERAIVQQDRSGALFYLPETLRIKAQILMSAPRPEPALAQECLQRSLELARAQSALSWELRAAIALARMHSGSHARETLRSVYARFVEGLETPDLRLARGLLEDTHSASVSTARA